MIDKELIRYLEGFLTEKRKALFKTILAQRTNHFTVVLEDIYQAHNTSAVIRTCDIFGLKDVHAIENKYTHKLSRHVAKGSQKWVNTKHYRGDKNNTADCLQDLRSKGYQLIATTPHNDSCLLQDFDISKKSAFIFGVEGTGVSEYVKEQADGFLKIPMVGFTESFNISVAAAIILQHVTTALRGSKIDWQLSEKEKEETYLNWVRKSIKNVKQIEAHFFENYKTH